MISKDLTHIKSAVQEIPSWMILIILFSLGLLLLYSQKAEAQQLRLILHPKHLSQAPPIEEKENLSSETASAKYPRRKSYRPIAFSLFETANFASEVSLRPSQGLLSFQTSNTFAPFLQRIQSRKPQLISNEEGAFFSFSQNKKKHFFSSGCLFSRARFPDLQSRATTSLFSLGAGKTWEKLSATTSLSIGVSKIQTTQNKHHLLSHVSLGFNSEHTSSPINFFAKAQGFFMQRRKGGKKNFNLTSGKKYLWRAQSGAEYSKLFFSETKIHTFSLSIAPAVQTKIPNRFALIAKVNLARAAIKKRGEIFLSLLANISNRKTLYNLSGGLKF